MNILIPGGCGYIGSRLVPKLLADGHRVTVFDTQWFGDGFLPDNINLTILKADVRDDVAYKKACLLQEVVIYLASISNNEMYRINYELTHWVNTLYRYVSRPRFIYASSAAVEDPSSDYAKDKLYCEKLLKGKQAIIVRAASVCGYSAHQRLDLTLNRMVHDAYKKGEITVNGGEQMRSHVHIDDLCDFYRFLVDARGVEGKTFTVVAENKSILDTALLVSRQIPVGINIRERTDDRSYTVTRSKEFEPRKTMEDAVSDLKIKFDSGFWPDSLTNPIYQNLNHEI